MPTEYTINKEDFVLTPDVNLPWMDDPRILVDGSVVEEDRLYKGCSQPYRVFADLLDSDRNINDVNSAWRTGDSVSFTFYKLVNDAWVTANYSPVKTAFANEPNAWHGKVEWRDVLDQDGVGCFRLVANSAIAGSTQPFIVWGIYTLEPYNISGARNPNVAHHAARVLSEFNDMNDYLGLDFTGSRVLDSVRLDAKIGYFNDNTEIDMVEYLDGDNQKVKIEDFVTYELRLNKSYFCSVEMLRMHLLMANDQWISDYNFDSYSYLTADIPVVLHEGLQPEFFDGSRGIKGVVKFKDKISKRRTHFQNNRITAQEDRPPNPPTICPPCPPAFSTSAKLLKTGQTTSYRTGDDGDIEAGRAVDFYTLAASNPFGNTTRFTDTLGTQIYADSVVLDWSTYDGNVVVGWRKFDNGVDITWDNAIDNAAAISIGTWTTGWRVPNDTEMHSLRNTQTSVNLNYAPWSIATNVRWWTSTTEAVLTTAVTVVPNRRFESHESLKTGSTSMRHLPCRTFTVTGTTLT